MRKLLAVVLLVSCWSFAGAQIPTAAPVVPGGSYLEQFSQLSADKLKETMPLGLFGLESRPEGVAYLPFWAFHAENDESREYLNVGLAASVSRDFAGVEPFAGGLLNLVAMSGAAWDFAWAKSHVKRTKFPSIFAGPMFKTPFDAGKLVEGFSSMDGFVKNTLRLAAGVRF